MKTANTNFLMSADCKALMVDDDPFQQAVLGDMLRDLGMRDISAAKDGASALSAIERGARAPDLVLCDLAMPSSDGFSLMEALGQRGFTGSVILVSGMDERTRNSAGLMGRFHGLRVAATLAKPVDAQALRTAVEKVLAGH